MTASSPQNTKRNISDFASTSFPQHGRVEMWRNGSVIRLEIEGPFNTDAIAALGATWRSLFNEQEKIDGPLADIVVCRKSLLTSPDAFACFEKFLAANTAAGLAPRTVAWVVPPEVEGATLMVRKFGEAYARHGRTFAALATEAEAESWLSAQMLGSQHQPSAPAKS